MEYRREIDGLRAIAVLPVILFHAGFEAFSGGFVGVDIFFVISGYLITSILIEDIEEKRFSIAKFYERRARRILPALYFTIFVTSCISTFIMLPSQLKEYGQSVLATLTFFSNVYFYLKTDYWAQATHFLPLLHTWSLAVEEQYYFVFPIFLAVFWRFGKDKLFWIMIVLAVTSLMLSELGWRRDSAANFYLATARAWELLAGAVAAFVVRRQGIKKNNFLSLLGLVSISFSVFFYDETTPFPSLYALVPVLGVVLLILYADKETLPARLLSLRPLVGIGLISYSAYLWHQPLLALARIWISDINLPYMYKVLIVFSSLAVACLSYKYVESPFRKANVISTKSILIFSFVPLVAFSLYGIYMHVSGGLLDLKYSLLSAETRNLMDKMHLQQNVRSELWRTTLKHSEDAYQDDAKTRILLLGDSLSEDLYVVSANSESLSRIANVRRLAFDDNCAKNLVTRANEINSDGQPCSSSVANKFSSDLFKQAEVLIVAAAWLSNAKYLEAFLSQRELKAKRIIVYKTHSFASISSMIMSLEGVEYSFSNDEFKRFIYMSKHGRTMSANAELQIISEKYGVPTINAYDAFCDESRKLCSLFSVDGEPFVVDQTHLSLAGIKSFEVWFSMSIAHMLSRS